MDFTGTVDYTDWSVRVTLSAWNTYDWAHRPGATWPCSTLSGYGVMAEFDRGGLIDLVVTENGRNLDLSGPYGIDIDGSELTAITSDAIREFLPIDHPCYLITVGQFEEDR